MDSVTVDGQQLAVVTSFCYLGDSISAGGGCEAATVTEGGGHGHGQVPGAAADTWFQEFVFTHTW